MLSFLSLALVTVSVHRGKTLTKTALRKLSSVQVQTLLLILYFSACHFTLIISPGRGICALEHMCRTENNLWKLVLYLQGIELRSSDIVQMPSSVAPSPWTLPRFLVKVYMIVSCLIELTFRANVFKNPNALPWIYALNVLSVRLLRQQQELLPVTDARNLGTVLA